MTAATTDLQIVHVPIDDLHPDPANPRKISDEQLDSLTRNIREFGFLQPVIARHDDHLVIGGHQRLVAARRLGYKQVPTIFVDLSPEQSHVLNLALNKISGDWDDQLLVRMLADLQASAVNLEVSGFGPDEINALLKGLEASDKRDKLETFDLDAALADAQATPITQPGDLWLLGDHRLLCGDSTNAEDVDRLFDGKLASLLATDPPYLVDYDAQNHPPSKGNKGKPSRNKHWDEYQDPEASVEFFAHFLKKGLKHLAPHSAIYQWHATRRQKLVEEAWGQCGLLVHQTIVWAKARGVLTRSHYLWKP